MGWKRSSEGWEQSTPPKSKIPARTAILTPRAASGLFLAPSTNFAHGVNAASLALEIRPGKHFAQQTRAKQHHASHQRQSADDDQRPLFADDVRAGPQLPRGQICEQASAPHTADQSPLAEEVHG